MKITKAQAQLLLQFMAEAAEAAVEDDQTREYWRIPKFAQQAEVFQKLFNEAEDSE